MLNRSEEVVLERINDRAHQCRCRRSITSGVQLEYLVIR